MWYDRDSPENREWMESVCRFNLHQHCHPFVFMSKRVDDLWCAFSELSYNEFMIKLSELLNDDAMTYIRSIYCKCITLADAIENYGRCKMNYQEQERSE